MCRSNRASNLKNSHQSRGPGFDYTPSSDADIDEEDTIEDSDAAKGPRSAFYVDNKPPELRDDYDPTCAEFHGMAEDKNDGGISEQLVRVGLGRKRILDGSGSDSEDTNSERVTKRARGSVSPKDGTDQATLEKPELAPLFPQPSCNTHLRAGRPGLDKSSMSDLSGYNGDTEREVEKDGKLDTGTMKAA